MGHGARALEGVVGLSGLEVRETSLHGVKAFRPRVAGDERGWFIRTLDADVLAEAGIDHAGFVQESQSRSVRRTLRGLHGRRALSEAKLVRCSSGAVFEVVVDLRPWSPTFLRQERFRLDDVEHLQLYIPPGCVHGYQCLSETADICYRMDDRYAPELSLYVAHDDPELAIEWPLEDSILSQRDRTAPRLAEVRPHLKTYFGAAAPTP